ncbi:MAG TPA: CAP domain-containing protein [Polyangia bacterium]|nr:CAP domain-containing protein [Polyangia bacterium]
MHPFAAIALAALAVRPTPATPHKRARPHRPAPAAQRHGRGLVPSGPAAQSYAPTSENVREPPGDLLRDRIIAEVRAVARHAGAPPLLEDPRLDWAVTDLARSLHGDDLPSREAVDFLMAHYGLIEPAPHLFMTRGNAASSEQMVQHAHEQAAVLLAAGPVGRVGIGVARHGDEVSLVAAFQDTPLDLLEPIPRQLPHGRTTTIHAQVVSRFRGPQVVVTTPDGQVHEAPPALRDTVSADLRCGPDGRYQVEVVANGEAGPAVLANFPVFCGVRPTAVLEGLVAMAKGSDDPEAAERELIQLVNRDRARAGLPALIPDANLAAIARAHSRDMAEHEFVGHVSPTTGTAMDRVRRAGLRPDLVLENVGRAYGAAEAESGFLASPGHRGNLLDPHARRLGVGVVFGREVTGTRPMYVTQLMSS